MADTRITPDHSAVKAEPVITGLGKYELRNRQIATVTKIHAQGWAGPFAEGTCSRGNTNWGVTDGRRFPLDFDDPYDIVARVDEPNEAATAKPELRVKEAGYYYRTRGNEVVLVTEAPPMAGGSGFATTCRGFVRSTERTYTWYANGRYSVIREHELDLIAGPFKTPAQAAKQEFGITGIGLYRSRRGDLIKITHRDDSRPYFKWRAGEGFGYKDDGSYWIEQIESPHDIVAGPFPEEPEAAVADAPQMAGHGYSPIELSNRNTIVPRSAWMKDLDMSQLGGKCGDANAFVDWSKVPLDAIVKPEPKRVKGWVNVYREDDGIFLGAVHDHDYEAKYDIPPDRRNKRIACIEVDFVEGQGL